VRPARYGQQLDQEKSLSGSAISRQIKEFFASDTADSSCTLVKGNY